MNFAIQEGLKASRSRIEWFNHNDINDLERLLMKQAERDRKVYNSVYLKNTETVVPNFDTFFVFLWHLFPISHLFYYSFQSWHRKQDDLW